MSGATGLGGPRLGGRVGQTWGLEGPWPGGDGGGLTERGAAGGAPGWTGPERSGAHSAVRG